MIILILNLLWHALKLLEENNLKLFESLTQTYVPKDAALCNPQTGRWDLSAVG